MRHAYLELPAYVNVCRVMAREMERERRVQAQRVINGNGNGSTITRSNVVEDATSRWVSSRGRGRGHHRSHIILGPSGLADAVLPVAWSCREQVCSMSTRCGPPPPGRPSARKLKRSLVEDRPRLVVGSGAAPGATEPPSSGDHMIPDSGVKDHRLSLVLKASEDCVGMSRM